jgi:hypothetical protein
VRLTFLIAMVAFAVCANNARAQDQVSPVSAALCQDMKAHRVLNAGAPVGCDRLRLVTYRYVDFDGSPRDDGRIVVLDAVADRVLQIFVALRARKFPIAKAKLMNAYDGDDDAAVEDNNTSSFNVRSVPGSTSISMHAYGLAIDLNPLQNPFIEKSGGKAGISPKAGAAYLDRRNLRPGMAETVVDIFAEHGFLVWGGEWRTQIDYQHFQVSRTMAASLIGASPVEARALFEQSIARYRACVGASANKNSAARRACARKSS